MSRSCAPGCCASIGLALALACGPAACGGMVAEGPPDSLTVDAGADVKLRPYVPRADAQPDRAVVPDAQQEQSTLAEYQEDACPQASPPPPEAYCDPLAGAADCPAGTSCYPFPPEGHDPCHPGPYTMECAVAGSGSQGSACGGGTDCQAGHVCAVTGRGNQCVRLCRPGAIGVCPEGMVCGRLDIAGLGGCL